jgi:hypothetical protein
LTGHERIVSFTNNREELIMRDINRIDRITYALNILWHKYPDLRFGQIVDMIQQLGTDLFYIEDEQIEEILTIKTSKKITERE